MSWREQAACRSRTDINWFPDPSDTRGLARAQLVCRDCPVKEECADHALVTGERWGVWAGVNVGIATTEITRARKNRKNFLRAERRRQHYAIDDEYAQTRREQAHTGRLRSV